MDVRLPDGTIIKNVPDGISKADLTQKLKTNGYDVSKLSDTSNQTSPLSLGDVLTNAVKNTPSSAYNFGANIVKAVAHPIDTGKAILDTGAGALRNSLPDSWVQTIDKFDPNPQAGQRASAQASAVGQELKNRYGGIENIKNTVATDPVGVAADLSSLFGGGAALTAKVATKAPALASTANALRTAADVTNPINALSAVASPVASAALTALEPKTQSIARNLMQSAIKPTIAQRASGEADTAINTLLKYGISPTKSGVNKLSSMIEDINNQIADRIQNSDAAVDKNKVVNALSDVRSKFINQVNPANDLNAIDKVQSSFEQHPYFQALESKGDILKDDLAKATQGKTQALQAAGKLKTFAAQQENLAHGGGVDLAKLQPEGQLYFNTSPSGDRVLSPSAYPVMGIPRIPGRYTNNIDRVPEGLSGYEDAMSAYGLRKADEAKALNALEKWNIDKNTLPVQQAQQLKQGTYKVLSNKYGEFGSAETEAQKGLARGLKEEIAAAVPGVGALNAEESKLLTTLNVSERRALLDANKNPMGLASLAHNPLSWAAFMADRSSAFKALAARIVNRSVPTANALGGAIKGVNTVDNARNALTLRNAGATNQDQ